MRPWQLAQRFCRIGKMSFAKLTVAPCTGGCVAAAGSVAGSSVAAASVGGRVSVAGGGSVGASVVGMTASVGGETGSSTGCPPQAVNSPTIETKSTICAYLDFIVLFAPKSDLVRGVQKGDKTFLLKTIENDAAQKCQDQ